MYIVLILIIIGVIVIYFDDNANDGYDLKKEEKMIWFRLVVGTAAVLYIMKIVLSVGV